MKRNNATRIPSMHKRAKSLVRRAKLKLAKALQRAFGKRPTWYPDGFSGIIKTSTVRQVHKDIAKQNEKPAYQSERERLRRGGKDYV